MLVESPHISAFDSAFLASTAFAGLLTWLGLNQRSVRGDYAIVFYGIVYASLYVVVCQLDQTVEAPGIFCLVLAGVYVSSTLFVTVIYRLSPLHPLAGYPGPRLWSISSLKLAHVSIKGRRHLILDDLHAKYGAFVRIGPNTLSINSPSGHLLYGSGHSMEKSEVYNTPGYIDAIAIFFKPKKRDLHSIRKRIWANAFTGSAVSNLLPCLEQRTRELMRCIERRREKDGADDMSLCFCHWSYDFMGEMVFGGSNNLELMRDGDTSNLVNGGKQATMVLDSAGQSPWLMDIIWHLPAGDLQRLRTVATTLMRTRRKADKETDMMDLSSYLLAGDVHSGEQIPEADLELDSMIAIQAGSDNTATALTLAIYFLLEQPQYYKILQAELDQAFPDRIGYIETNKLADLPFLNAVLNESLRLSTPFFLPRVVPQGGTTINGKFIPEGTIVALAAYSQQVSSKNFYPDPMDFRPERWLPKGLGPNSITQKSALASFSSGPYICLAKSFAYLEMRFVLARLVLVFDMTLPESFDVKAFRDGVLNMRTTILEKPLMVKPTRRPGLNLDSFL